MEASSSVTPSSAPYELDKYLSDDWEEGNDDVFEILQFWKD